MKRERGQLVFYVILIFSTSFPFYGKEETVDKVNVYKILWLNTRLAENISEKNLELLLSWGFFTKYNSWLEYYKAAFGNSLSPEQERRHKISIAEKQKFLAKENIEFQVILAKSITDVEHGKSGPEIAAKLNLLQIKEMIEKKNLDYYIIFCSKEFGIDKKNPIMWMMPVFQYYAGKHKVKMDYCLSAVLPGYPTEVSFTYKEFTDSSKEKETKQCGFYEKFASCLLETMGGDNKIIVISLNQ